MERDEVELNGNLNISVTLGVWKMCPCEMVTIGITSSV